MFHIEHNPDHALVISDYYPLTIGEISDLLHAARSAQHHTDAQTSSQSVASVQDRLGQGIVGLECPRQIDGLISDRYHVLGEFYVAWVKIIGEDEEIGAWTVRQFDLLINGGECCETDAPAVIEFYRSVGQF